MATNSTYTAKIILLCLIVLAGVTLCKSLKASEYTDPGPGPTIIDNSTNIVESGGYSPGTAIAGASGLCVKDWKPGWQKCIAWTMIDVESDENVHGFGGGVTTRVDQFAVHLFAGIEDIEGDDTTVLIGGSLNWR